MTEKVDFVLVGYRNLYVSTDAGVIDFLGGFSVPVMGLEDLLTAKRAVARPKDLRVVSELERVLERKKQP